jgi:hypothetical protein
MRHVSHRVVPFIGTSLISVKPRFAPSGQVQNGFAQRLGGYGAGVDGHAADPTARRWRPVPTAGADQRFFGREE